VQEKNGGGAAGSPDDTLHARAALPAAAGSGLSYRRRVESAADETFLDKPAQHKGDPAGTKNRRWGRVSGGSYALLSRMMTPRLRGTI